MEQKNSKCNVTFFLGIGRSGRVFHLFCLFHLTESGTAGRARITEIVVIGLDGLWTFIQE